MPDIYRGLSPVAFAVCIERGFGMNVHAVVARFVVLRRNGARMFLILSFCQCVLAILFQRSAEVVREIQIPIQVDWSSVRNTERNNYFYLVFIH